MKQNEFIDLLRHYFRNSDPDDLKGILADCEEAFNKGKKKGISEEKICQKLGHPHNIYRLYMGEEINPEENAQLTYVNPYTPPTTPYAYNQTTPSTDKPQRFTSEHSGNIVGRILGRYIARLFYTLTGIAILFGIVWNMLPPYCLSEWLPLPKISLFTLIGVVLSFLFAGFTGSSLAYACRKRRRRLL